ncbi:hypothetical protein V8C44DRAFT_158157 [Trichoderma aethiopicum]
MICNTTPQRWRWWESMIPCIATAHIHVCRESPSGLEPGTQVNSNMTDAERGGQTGCLSCRVARRASLFQRSVESGLPNCRGSMVAVRVVGQCTPPGSRWLVMIIVPSPLLLGIGRARADPGRRESCPPHRVVCARMYGWLNLVAALSPGRPSHEPLVAEASNQGQSKVSGSRNPNRLSAFQGEPPKGIIGVGVVRSRCHVIASLGKNSSPSSLPRRHR